jgi:ketosteroid isomerase-like protein
MDTTSPSDISAFLDRYAEALAAGDLPGIAACYALPALVVGDASTIPVTEAAQVEAAFAGAADAYRARAWSGSAPSCGPSIPSPPPSP